MDSLYCISDSQLNILRHSERD